MNRFVKRRNRLRMIRKRNWTTWRASWLGGHVVSAYTDSVWSHTQNIAHSSADTSTRRPLYALRSVMFKTFRLWISWYLFRFETFRFFPNSCHSIWCGALCGIFLTLSSWGFTRVSWWKIELFNLHGSHFVLDESEPSNQDFQELRAIKYNTLLHFVRWRCHQTRLL